MPQRFVFVFTPKHGSWLNLIEIQFSKMTRSVLRGILTNPFSITPPFKNARMSFNSRLSSTRWAI